MPLYKVEERFEGFWPESDYAVTVPQCMLSFVKDVCVEPIHEISRLFHGSVMTYTVGIALLGSQFPGEISDGNVRCRMETEQSRREISVVRVAYRRRVRQIRPATQARCLLCQARTELISLAGTLQMLRSDRQFPRDLFAAAPDSRGDTVREEQYICWRCLTAWIRMIGAVDPPFDDCNHKVQSRLTKSNGPNHTPHSTKEDSP
jgi:hypothetical protein